MIASLTALAIWFSLGLGVTIQNISVAPRGRRGAAPDDGRPAYIEHIAYICKLECFRQNVVATINSRCCARALKLCNHTMLYLREGGDLNSCL